MKNNIKEERVYHYKDNVKVYFNNKKVSLPKTYSEKIEEHWSNLKKDGKHFFRGDVFAISNIEKDKGDINIFVEKTDYAHYLYTVDKNVYEDYDCRIIHTSVLIETLDNKFVLGEMNTTTAAPNIIQFAGGGIDEEDIRGNVFDMEENIKKEILEEIGIETHNKNIVKSLKPFCLKSGGKYNFLSTVFKLDLLINEEEVMDIFNKHVSKLKLKNISPEFTSLVFIPANAEMVEDFIYVDTRKKNANIIPVLKAAVGLKVIESIENLK